MKLFSYVVEHDYGTAPCPTGGYCTLARCKYSKSGRPNLVELAQVGDWIIGTGGADLDKSAGHGKIVYAMRVDEKLPLSAYSKDKRFRGRQDGCQDDDNEANEANRFALISQQFFYFGRNAIKVDGLPLQNLAHPLEKKGPGFRSDFDESFIKELAEWIQNKYGFGVHGKPCGNLEGHELCP